MSPADDAAVERPPVPQAPAGETAPPKIAIADLGVTYLADSPAAPPTVALAGLTLDVAARGILTIIGPARSGKSTLLRAINRLHDENPAVRITGEIRFDGVSIRAPESDPVEIRRRAGLVFARPVVLPGSILDNAAYGLRVKGGRSRGEIAGRVERALRQAYLWDEVKDRLAASARSLSGGQQQRLCVARALALDPEILLLDEPTSALDPVSTMKIEDTLTELSAAYTIVLVTNNVKQAARVGTRTAFFLMGKMVEHAPTGRLFTAPADRRTEDYITGRFG